MPMVRAIRMLNAMEAGLLSGSQLESLIATDPSRGGELNVLMNMRGQYRRMLSSNTTVASLAGSATALRMAMAIDPIAVKLALYESDEALAAVLASSSSMDNLRALATVYNKQANGATSVSLSTGVTPSNPLDSGKYLLLGVSGGASRIITVDTRRVGSTRPNAGQGDVSANNTASTTLLSCPVTGPLSFRLSASGTNFTFFSLLRCDA